MAGIAGIGGPTRPDGPLTLAVPRGALFIETLDVLDAAGVDTSPLRGDSRSLIFETDEMTLVTMRPSDVPTYVEAGAADGGGEDVVGVQADLGVLLEDGEDHGDAGGVEP